MVEPLRVRGRICFAEQCQNKPSAQGYCPMHYQRFIRGGVESLDREFRYGGYRPGDMRPCWWCHKEFKIIDGRNIYCSEEHAKFVKSLWNVGKYGITRDDYRDAWYRQGGVCAVCKQPERTARNHLLSIDHDHETGRFRGLLCSHCNRAIGLLQDDPKIIAAAANYLLQGVINHGFI